MTLAALHKETVARLIDNPDKVAQRRDAIAGLARARKRTLKLDRLRRRAGIWFSTTQGNAFAGKGALCVQMLGVGIGSLVFEKCWLFRPTKKTTPSWRWSNCREDGALINDYLESRKRSIRAARENNKGNEREIQWQLAKALSSKNENANHNLRWLQPVKMGGFPLEIGISVSRQGEVKRGSTGNIDLLLKQRGGAAGGGLLVLELKAPGAKKDKDIRGALEQAIRYATALDFEANGNREETKEQMAIRATYRCAFGLKESGKGSLRLGVVIAMEDAGREFQDAAREQLKACCCEKGDSPIERIDMLLYDMDGEMAHGWRWLENWNPPSPFRRVVC